MAKSASQQPADVVASGSAPCSPSDFVFGATKVRGIFVGPTNPRRDGIFVEHIHRRGKQCPGHWVRLMDGKGDFWMYERKAVVVWREGDTEADVAKRADELYQAMRPR